MPPSDYLNTCTNIPTLPSGWNWYLSTVRISRDSTSRPGVYKDWVDIHISISDDTGTVMGSTTMYLLKDRLDRAYTGDLNSDLVKACYKAYNSMYRENKVDIHEALKYA